MTLLSPHLEVLQTRKVALECQNNATFEATAPGTALDEAAVIAPGWGISEHGMVGLRHAIASCGMHAISFGHNREGQGGDSAANIGDIRLRNVMEVMNQARDQLGIERFHLVGWSLGSIDVVRAAEEESERVGSVHMLASVGYEQDFSPEMLARRISAQFGSHGRYLLRRPTQLVSRGLELARDAVRHPAVLLSEAEYAFHSDISPGLRALGNAGLILHDVQFAGDKLFPPVSRDETLPLQTARTVKGDHLSPCLEAKEVARVLFAGLQESKKA